ncbi:MAG: hypothetical protein ACT4OZ_14425 [Gemmatimonadota bacterium]
MMRLPPLALFRDSPGSITATPARLLAVLVAFAATPLGAASQGVRPGAQPPARIGATQSAPPARTPETDRISPERPPLFPCTTCLGGWSAPWIVYSEARPLPTPMVTPVPWYYPVPIPVATGGRQPAGPDSPPKPYNSAASRITVVGAGTDGGGGVMRITRGEGDSLHVTWLGSSRPVQHAVAFLADSLKVRFAATTLTSGTTRTTFRLSAKPQPAWVGIEVTHIDGSMRTTLVPVPTR